jgi:hypothetical protein
LVLLKALHANTNCRASSSMEVVQELCESKQVCLLTASQVMFGEDPCAGTYKYLEVDFECVDKGRFYTIFPRQCPITTPLYLLSYEYSYHLGIILSSQSDHALAILA